jgi:hypothetical protein
MAKKSTKRRRWTKEDVLTLETLACKKVKVGVIARKLKRSPEAMRQKGTKLGVMLRTSRKERGA